MEATAEQKQAWNEWAQSRPAHVRNVVLRFKPWLLYRMKSTQHRVFIISFDEAEDGGVTLMVGIIKEFNPDIAFDRQVFGIDPDDLELCLPETLQ